MTVALKMFTFRVVSVDNTMKLLQFLVQVHLMKIVGIILTLRVVPIIIMTMKCLFLLVLQMFYIFLFFLGNDMLLTICPSFGAIHPCNSERLGSTNT